MSIDYEPQLNKELDCIDMFLVERKNIPLDVGDEISEGRSIDMEFSGRLYLVDRHYVLQVPIHYSQIVTQKPIVVYNTSNREKAIGFGKRDLGEIPESVFTTECVITKRLVSGVLYKVDRLHHVLQVSINYEQGKFTEKPIAIFEWRKNEKAILLSEKYLENRLQ